MRRQIAAPKNWQDFEELCLRLWRDMWGDPHAQKNGRGGQNQHGIDVFGKSAYDGQLHGVQCKGKNANYGAQLTDKEIYKEADNADGFDDNLSSFTMATTAPRDEKLQAVCRDLNESNVHKFTVSVWSWDDIEDELQYRTDIIKHCGLEYDDKEQESLSIKISRITSKERLQAFVTRPAVVAVTSKTMRVLLHHVFYEIMQNAFIHGKATHCMLLYDDFKFTLMDDGGKFNPNALLPNKGSGGAITITRLFNECKEGLKSNYDYREVDDKLLNVYTMTFTPEMLGKEISNKVEFMINQDFQIQTRTEAGQLAIEQMSLLTPTDDVSVLFGDMVNNSNVKAYVSSAVRIVDPERLTVSLHSSQAGLEEQLKELTPNVHVR